MHRVVLMIAVFLLAGAVPVAAQSAQNFTGVWVGLWTGDNFVYAPELHLTVDAANKANGSIKWTVKSADPARTDYRGKIGLTGTEYVAGRVEGRELILDGYRLDDPNHIIGMDKYRLLLSDDGSTLGGITATGNNT